MKRHVSLIHGFGRLSDPVFLPFDGAVLDEGGNHFFIGVQAGAARFDLEKHDFAQGSFGQAVQHQVVEAFSNKDHVLGGVGKIGKEGQDLFVDCSQNDGTGAFDGVFSFRGDLAVSGESANEEAQKRREKHGGCDSEVGGEVLHGVGVLPAGGVGWSGRCAAQDTASPL